MKDRESTLEAGLMLMGIIIAAAMAILIAARTISFGQRRTRRLEPHPMPGEVEIERHQHVSTVAAR